MDEVPVLFVTGSIGVGKTAVLREADSLLIRADIRHATVELEEAVPGALVTVVRLHAPLDVVEQRIRGRERSSPDAELDGARWWTRHFEREQPEDYLVESDQRPVREIAAELLRLAGWLT
jgi:chloramphenicol 3-O-phosphotransferase